MLYGFTKTQWFYFSLSCFSNSYKDVKICKPVDSIQPKHSTLSGFQITAPSFAIDPKDLETNISLIIYMHVMTITAISYRKSRSDKALGTANE